MSLIDPINESEIYTASEKVALRESQLIQSFLDEERDLDQCESEHYYSEHAREFGLIGLED